MGDGEWADNDFDDWGEGESSEGAGDGHMGMLYHQEALKLWDFLQQGPPARYDQLWEALESCVRDIGDDDELPPSSTISDEHDVYSLSSGARALLVLEGLEVFLDHCLNASSYGGAWLRRYYYREFTVESLLSFFIAFVLEGCGGTKSVMKRVNKLVKQLLVRVCEYNGVRIRELAKSALSGPYGPFKLLFPARWLDRELMLRRVRVTLSWLDEEESSIFTSMQDWAFLGGVLCDDKGREVDEVWVLELCECFESVMCCFQFDEEKGEVVSSQAGGDEAGVNAFRLLESWFCIGDKLFDHEGLEIDHDWLGELCEFFEYIWCCYNEGGGDEGSGDKGVLSSELFKRSCDFAGSMSSIVMLKGAFSQKTSFSDYLSTIDIGVAREVTHNSHLYEETAFSKEKPMTLWPESCSGLEGASMVDADVNVGVVACDLPDQRTGGLLSFCEDGLPVEKEEPLT